MKPSRHREDVCFFMPLKMIPTETHGVPDRQKCALPRYTAAV